MFTYLHIDSTAYDKNSIKNFFPLRNDTAMHSANHYILHKRPCGLASLQILHAAEIKAAT